MTEKLALQGFNNLTKTLSFNIYDICYAGSEKGQNEYIEYIDEEYNAERLTQILTQVADIIGATILNVAHQDYDPQGASVTMLIAEEDPGTTIVQNTEEPGPLPTSVVTHLDKSHLTVHTYPESHPHEGISSFRVDIDVSTCGQISPLKALNFLIHSFDSDIVVLDYRVRGFTRDVSGKKHYIDHKINSIQYFLTEETKMRYQMMDVNIYQENIFHTKMRLRDFNVDDYWFGDYHEGLTEEEKEMVSDRLYREMEEIFNGRLIP